MIIRCKAPLRISFAGGGTDVPPYTEEFGGCVLSCTINKYAYASLTPRKDKKISLKSIDFNLERVLPNDEHTKFLFQEHAIRYLFASQFTTSKTVLS